MATAQEAHEMQCHSPQRTLCQLGFHTLNILESQSRRIRTRSQTLFIRTVARISSKTNRRLTEKPMDIPPLRNAPDRIPWLPCSGNGWGKSPEAKLRRSGGTACSIRAEFRCPLLPSPRKASTLAWV